MWLEISPRIITAIPQCPLSIPSGPAQSPTCHPPCIKQIHNYIMCRSQKQCYHIDHQVGPSTWVTTCLISQFQSSMSQFTHCILKLHHTNKTHTTYWPSTCNTRASQWDNPNTLPHPKKLDLVPSEMTMV